MKKILLIMVSIALAAFICNADGIKQAITFEQLPAAGTSFLKKYFASQTPASIIMEKEHGRIEYEIYYPNGVKVELNQAGEWKKVDGNGNIVPTGFYPAGIDSAIAAAYPGARIMQIEKKYAGYEVDLNNGLELKFNQSLQMRVDD